MHLISIIHTLLAALITLISLAAAQKSYIAITNLQKYEARSERAAKHSQTAADQLWKTRVTQGSSAGAILLSLLSSLALLTRALTSAPPGANWAVALPVLNNLAITAAFVHNRSFWGAKAMVPFVEGFNEGIRKSGDIRDLLVVIGGGWAVVGVLGLGLVGG